MLRIDQKNVFISLTRNKISTDECFVWHLYSQVYTVDLRNNPPFVPGEFFLLIQQSKYFSVILRNSVRENIVISLIKVYKGIKTITFGERFHNLSFPMYLPF